MTRLRVTRDIRVPDPIRLERYRRTPELGPKILFFSGGTALKELSRELTVSTHNSIHIITPFDSGGSSAKLRASFGMPAVGDIRNRLMALADQTLHGNPETYVLFAYRLAKDEPRDALLAEVEEMAEGKHPLVAAIPDPMRKIIRNHLHDFLGRMTLDFDLCGASVGNLVLTSGYLANRRLLDPVIYIFSRLVEVRGVVRPVVNADAHLAVELENGAVVCGQHRFTGKQSAPLTSPIRRIWLTADVDRPDPAEVAIREKMRTLIGEAELICYPMGSFYSSLLANLLPRGVGSAVAANGCPKVFIPNMGRDPELFGHELMTQVRRLLDYARRDDPENIAESDVLDFIIVDTARGGYSGELDAAWLSERGIEIVDQRLVNDITPERIDAGLLAPVLLSLC